MDDTQAATNTKPRALEFGKVFSDHVLVAHHDQGKWTSPTLCSYARFGIAPSNAALHYGQSVFEGLKVYRGQDGTSLLFRPADHFRRLARSATRMAMPTVPREIFFDGIRDLVRADRSWIPAAAGHALYLRPLLFATDECIGVRESTTHSFVVMASPAPDRYRSSIALWLSRDNVRAFPGGTGNVKTSGNYGAALMASRHAKARGFDEVLWVDSGRRQFVEECGTMNVFFVIGSKVVTPEASGTILPGVTRASVLRLLEERGTEIELRRISVEELRAHHRTGKLRECFATGTASGVVRVARIGMKRLVMELPEVENGGLAELLRGRLGAIHRGARPAPRGWVVPVR